MNDRAWTQTWISYSASANRSCSVGYHACRRWKTGLECCVSLWPLDGALKPLLVLGPLMGKKLLCHWYRTFNMIKADKLAEYWHLSIFDIPLFCFNNAEMLYQKRRNEPLIFKISTNSNHTIILQNVGCSARHRQVYDCSFTFLLYPESCLQLKGQGAQACVSVLATYLIDLATQHTTHNTNTLTHTHTHTHARWSSAHSHP